MNISTEIIPPSVKGGGVKSESHFIFFLKNEYVKKVKVNQNFSLRSYARFLGIHFATLSLLMSGKRPVTAKTIQKLASRLNASEKDIDLWISEISDRSSKNFKEVADIRYHILEEESLLLMSEWYHDVIVELVYTEHFKKDPSWIARVCGISYIEAEMALSRLFKLGQLVEGTDGNWAVAHDFKSSITSDLKTNSAMKKYQKDLLKKGLDAIEIVPIEDRTNTSLVVAISKDQLHEIREEIRALRSKINQMALSGHELRCPDSVYCFTFSGFPVAVP